MCQWTLIALYIDLDTAHSCTKSYTFAILSFIQRALLSRKRLKTSGHCLWHRIGPEAVCILPYEPASLLGCCFLGVEQTQTQNGKPLLLQVVRQFGTAKVTPTKNEMHANCCILAPPAGTCSQMLASGLLLVSSVQELTVN